MIQTKVKGTTQPLKINGKIPVPVPCKTNGKRNRAAGHSAEIDLVNELKTIGFPHVVTTRNESRLRDSQKIDVMNRDEGKNGRLPYNIQSKSVTGALPYGKLLAELPDNSGDGIINVLLHKQTEKRGTRFFTRDKFAIMYQRDWMCMIQRILKMEQAIAIYNNYFDAIPEEMKKEMDEELKKIGL